MIAKTKIYYLLNLLFLLTPEFIYTTASADRVIATIMVGDTPSGIALTPDNKFAYVANNNNDGLLSGNTVSVLNLTNNTLAQTISDASFNQPYTVTINAAGTKAYVTNSAGSTITIIDIATNIVTGLITGFDGPSGMVITPDGNTAYVNNYGAAGGVGSGNGTTVRVVDLNTNTIIGGAITVGLAPASLAITPNGKYVYAINYVDGNPGTGTVSVIRTSDNTVIKTIPGFSGPFAIEITPNGRYAYVTNFGSNNFAPVGTTVSVIDLSTNMITATVKLGTQPAGVAITPDGCFAYVTNYYTLYLGPSFTNLTAFVGTINVIDVATNKVLCPVIIVGSSPGDIVISSDGTRAYVTNYSSNNVSVLNIIDRMWLKTCAPKNCN